MGVGRLGPSRGFVPSDGCTLITELSSPVPGKTVVKVRLGDFSQEKTFFFLLPLSWGVILLALLGGGAGAFVRAGFIFSKSRRWSSATWIISLITGAMIGLLVFLLCYFGLMKAAASVLTSGKGISFVLGFVGGLVGPDAAGKIGDLFFPPRHRPNAQA